MIKKLRKLIHKLDRIRYTEIKDLEVLYRSETDMDGERYIYEVKKFNLLISCDLMNENIFFRGRVNDLDLIINTFKKCQVDKT